MVLCMSRESFLKRLIIREHACVFIVKPVPAHLRIFSEAKDGVYVASEAYRDCSVLVTSRADDWCDTIVAAGGKELSECS